MLFTVPRKEVVMDKSLMLNPADYVGVSFWIISAAMVAATYFFYVERDRAVGKWKTSLTVASALAIEIR